MNPLFSFNTRYDGPEWMDQPEISQPELVRALKEIRWVNRYLGGTSTILNEIKNLQSDKTLLEILDLGTGSADIPRALVDWGRSRNMQIHVTAVDLNSQVIEEAQILSAGYPEIYCLEGDALNLPYEDGRFDFVISSMFMHHLQEVEAESLLRTMARVSKLGFAVNDLERHPLAWLGIRVLGQLSGKSPMFMNDAPLSVRKGFSYVDLECLCERAGLEDYVIKRKYPFRWLLTWRKDR